MAAYYNDMDGFKAAVIRAAIAAGAIAQGNVDERSIADVRPDELRNYTQCHFFAGGGFWSLAARQAGWPDDRELWTASLPCPSFSCAGKGSGFDDPRHLWPVFAPLVRECRPGVIVGEQADDAVGFGWLDLVSGDLEAEGYAVAAAVLGAHSVGAPHVRQRLYWCAVADSARREAYWTRPIRTRQSGKAGLHGSMCGGPDLQGDRWTGRPNAEDGGRRECPSGHCGEAGSSAHADGRESCDGDIQRSGEHGLFAPDCGAGDSGNAVEGRRGSRRRIESSAGEHSSQRSASGNNFMSPNKGACVGDRPIGAGLEGHFGDVREWRGPGWLDPLAARSVAEAGATRGFWGDCDWWYGRDEKYRPIGPGLFPLAHGSAARVGRLRMYGDAICVPLAAAFLKSVMECLGA